MGNPISILLNSALATKVCDGLQTFAWEFGVRHAAYVYQLEDNLEALLKAAEDLKVMKKMVVRKIRDEKRHRMQTSEDVELWLSRVEAATVKAVRLKKEGEQAVQRLCLGGICSTDYFSTSVFGGSVTKCIKDLQDLKVTGENFGEVVVEVPAEPESGTEKPCGPTVGLETKLDEVLSYLEQERAGIVGVYGQGGVGKTTLLKKINNHFTRKSDFLVIWIDVPKDLNLESIQRALGEKIGLPEESTNKSQDQKAAYIYKQLQRKKIILLLDDFKGAVDLTKIGVPPAESLNETRVVFTTRIEQVCKQMEPQPDKNFSVETLEEEPSWQLFLMKAGQDTINSHPEIPHLAKTVVKKCGGLPLALTIIGKSMSCKREPKAWERAIKTFESPTHKHSQDREHEHAMSELFSLLRYSYDNLPSDIVGVVGEHLHDEQKLDEVVGEDQTLQPFSNLTAIGFLYLPKLESIYTRGTLPLRFLRHLAVFGCPNLKKLPVTANSIPRCPQIQLHAEEDWWNAIEWEDDATRDALLSRFKLKFLNPDD